MAEEKKDGDREKSLVFSSPNTLKGLGEEAFWYAKVEKIGHAIFFVMRQGNSAGVLTGQIREKILNLIEVASFCVTDHGLREEFLVRLLEMGTLLRLASTAGEIGEDNARILTTEIVKLSDRVALYSRGSIPSSILAVSGEEGENPHRLAGIAHLFGKETKDTSVPESGDSFSRTSYRAKDMSFNKRHTGPVPITERSQQILSVVKEKGRVSIKEVSALFTDCSEKTIQRELAALVERGLLRKEGERRWSTYTLA